MTQHNPAISKMSVVMNKSLLVAAMLLVIAASMISITEAAGRARTNGVIASKSYPAPIVRRMYISLYKSMVIAKRKNLNFILMIRTWMQSIANCINRPLRSLSDVYHWRNWVAGALTQPFYDRNPWVRCVKVAWPRCVKLMGGVNPVADFACPWHTYWECEHAHEISRHPVYKGGYKPFLGGGPRLWAWAPPPPRRRPRDEHDITSETEN